MSRRSSAQALSLYFSYLLGYYSPGKAVHKIRTCDRIRQRIGSIGKAQPNRHFVSLGWGKRSSERQSQCKSANWEQEISKYRLSDLAGWELAGPTGRHKISR